VEVVQKLGTVLKPTDTEKTLNRMINPLLLIVFIAGLFCLFQNRKKLFLSREQRLLIRFYKTVERDCKQKIRQGEQGLFEIAEICLNKNVREFVEIYAGAVYRDRDLNSEEYKQLRSILEKGFRMDQIYENTEK
jgi:hypothetical protein